MFECYAQIIITFENYVKSFIRNSLQTKHLAAQTDFTFYSLYLMNSLTRKIKFHESADFGFNPPGYIK